MAVPLSFLPSGQRPRERLLVAGVEALTDSELLALVVRSGGRGESAVDLATRLLCTFGGLVGLAGARPEELDDVTGVGPAKASAVVAALRLGRSLERSEQRAQVRSTADVASIAQAHLRGLRRERVIVLVCDSQHRTRHVVSVSDGSVDRALLPVREILNAVLRHDGRAFAVAHNHPGGDPTPSDADLLATTRLIAAAEVVGLRFLDHVIVTDDRWEAVRPTAAA